jgi:hypothetical protein
VVEFVGALEILQRPVALRVPLLHCLWSRA